MTVTMTMTEKLHTKSVFKCTFWRCFQELNSGRGVFLLGVHLMRAELDFQALADKNLPEL